MPPDVPGLYARYGVQLLRRGSRRAAVRCFTGRHKDRHPSAVVNLQTGGFKCFTCNVGGGVLDALQLLGERDRSEALRIAVDYGVLEARRARRPLPGLHRASNFAPAAGTDERQGRDDRTGPVASEATRAADRSAGPVDWDQLPRAPAKPPRRWVYVDERGTPVGRVCRLDLPEGKRIWQERALPDGRFAPGMEGRPLPLYRLPEVRERARQGRLVLLVEGEKAVDALDRIGWMATTNPGGAGKWRPEHTAALRGAQVIVVADCDRAGREHALRVTQELLGAGIDVRGPLDPQPYSHDGFDIVDHLAGVAQTVRAVSPDVEPLRLRQMLHDHFTKLTGDCWPANAEALRTKLELLRFEDDPAGKAILRCERCKANRVHRLSAGFAFCPCGAHQLAPP